MKPIFNENFVEKISLWVSWTVHETQVWTQTPDAFAIQTHTQEREVHQVYSLRPYLGSPPPKEVDQMNDYKQSCVLIKIEMIENI